MKSQRGQALVETALILLAFLSLLLGMGAVGEKLFIQQTLTERAHDAARSSVELNPWYLFAIRNLVLYGTTEPEGHPDGFDGLAPSDIVVANPGCPGPECRRHVRDSRARNPKRRSLADRSTHG